MVQSQTLLTEGTTPRNFVVTEDGSYLVAALRYEDKLAVYSISQEDGALQLVDSEIEEGMLPAIIAFS